jgi:hypothetical protein
VAHVGLLNEIDSSNQYCKAEGSCRSDWHGAKSYTAVAAKPSLVIANIGYKIGDKSFGASTSSQALMFRLVLFAVALDCSKNPHRMSDCWHVAELNQV